MDFGQATRTESESLSKPDSVIEGAFRLIQLEVVVEVAGVPQKPFDLGVRLTGVPLTKGRGHGGSQPQEKI